MTASSWTHAEKKTALLQYRVMSEKNVGERARSSPEVSPHIHTVMAQIVRPILLGERNTVTPDEWATIFDATEALSFLEANLIYGSWCNLVSGQPTRVLGVMNGIVNSHRDRFLRFFVDNGRWVEQLADMIDTPAGVDRSHARSVSDARLLSARRAQLQVRATQCEQSRRAVRFDTAAYHAFAAHHAVLRQKWPTIMWSNPTSVPVCEWASVALTNEPDFVAYAVCYACRHVPIMSDRIQDMRTKFARLSTSDAATLTHDPPQTVHGSPATGVAKEGKRRKRRAKVLCAMISKVQRSRRVWHPRLPECA